MKVPNFKIVLQKLSVLRNNTSLLIAVVVGVVSIGLFVPTQFMSSKLKRQIGAESVAQGRTIQSSRASALSSEQWKQEKKYQQLYTNDANQIELLVHQSSQRQLLSYRIFPDAKDKSELIFEEFGRQFRAAVERKIAQINATDRPAEAELERSLQSSSVRNRFGGRSTRSFSRSPMSYGSLFRGSVRVMNDIDATIMDEICRDKAQSGSVYAQPVDVSGYEFWGEYQHPGREEAVKDCWYWQLGYWIVEDVFDTIAACNAGSKSVITSPVKRLIRVSFTLSERRSMSMRYRPTAGVKMGRKSMDDKPSYVLSTKDGLTIPCTGRFSNEDFDVMHFNVVVLVSADAVLPFMRELCSAKEHKFSGWDGRLEPQQTCKRNQITILESNVKPVEREIQDHALYRYGDDAVEELDLICEYIFDRAGYDAIKPETIKTDLKGEEKKK
ncbi:MAG: hypothetical protein MUP16_04820 [Sedimentisphaerales bacterium]|nr:hypothetical protein [Sedimentisphaerales bacterium]